MKKSLADRIEQYIKVLVDRSDNNQIEIQRSELSETFNCVPSQVTYVLSTRFTEKEGYYTESRRGGKGFVRITRFKHDEEDKGIVELFAYIDKLLYHELLDTKQTELIKHMAVYVLRNHNKKTENKIIKDFIQALDEYIKL